MAHIPIIDMDDPTRDVNADVRDALAHVGFFYCAIPDEIQLSYDQLMRGAKSFFSLCQEEKSSIGITNFRGYSGLGSEVTLGKKDWHECIDWMSDQTDETLPFFGENCYHETIPANVVEAYMAHCSKLAFRVVEAICSQEFRGAFGEPFSILRLLRYPPQPEAPGIGIGEHSDYGCITLLQADAPGLQVEIGGAWIDLYPKPTAFAVNIGDALAEMTGYKATRHRVVTQTERASAAFFFEPSLQTAFKDSTYGDYLLSKYQYSFPSLEKEEL